MGDEDYMQAWRRVNKEHVREYQKKWVAENKEHVKQYEKDNIESRRESKKKYMQKHRKQNPGLYESEAHKKMIKNSTLKGKYGITLEEYDKMFFEQDYRCAICDTHQDDCKSVLVVDHCHKTIKLRKLLCRKCNALLGMCNDDRQILAKAIKYLDKWTEE